MVVLCLRFELICPASLAFLRSTRRWLTGTSFRPRFGIVWSKLNSTIRLFMIGAIVSLSLFPISGYGSVCYIVQWLLCRLRVAASLGRSILVLFVSWSALVMWRTGWSCRQG